MGTIHQLRWDRPRTRSAPEISSSCRAGRTRRRRVLSARPRPLRPHARCLLRAQYPGYWRSDGAWRLRSQLRDRL